VAKDAVARGVPTMVRFFGEALAREMVAEGRQADLLIGNNVLAQVPDLNDFVKGMKILLKPGGVPAEESVHLTDFPEVDPAFVDEKLARSYETLIEVRRDVLKQIEVERAKKVIGHPLEAAVTVYADEEILGLLKEKRAELAPLFVVSRVDLAPKNGAPAGAHSGERVDVSVEKAGAQKCARCWRYLESVGSSGAHPELCGRCSSVVTAHYS